VNHTASFEGTASGKGFYGLKNVQIQQKEDTNGYKDSRQAIHNRFRMSFFFATKDK
jgi:hypothetical protein